MTIFQKIIDKEIPADIVFENEHALAFRDINPQAPTHILVIPRKPLAKISEMAPEDTNLMGELMLAVTQVAKQENLEDYRLVVNNGAGVGQTVFHLHIHILAGRQFGWPPG